MKFEVCVVAAAAMLLAHSELPGQAAPPRADSVTHTVQGNRTTVRFPAANRPPSWGFAIGMKSGPNLSYTQPYVTQVVKGSTAEQAGLVQGDTIIAVDGRDTRQPPMFADTAPGIRHVMRIRRAGEELELTFVMPPPTAP